MQPAMIRARGCPPGEPLNLFSGLLVFDHFTVFLRCFCWRSPP